MPVLDKGGGSVSRDAFTPEMLDAILQIIKRGNTAEIKKERDNLVVVEIDRKVKVKTPIIG